MSTRNDVEMCPCGKNEAFMVNRVDESFKAPLIVFSEDIEECKEHVGDTHVANQKARG